MASLDDDFDELRERITRGRDLGSTGYEPIYYLVFPPAKILEVKRRTDAWKTRLEHDGFHVEVFSMATAVVDFLKSDKRRDRWLSADRKAPLDFKRTSASLSQALVGSRFLQKKLDELLGSLESKPKAIVLVTDLEALHPYLRIGSIEAQLQGRFRVPTVFLYPGLRTGTTKLKFLGFYPEDGNYRSVHVGG
jgi:hypothetical protein